MQPPYRVLIIDDHPIVLFGLRALFAQQPRFVLCGEAMNAPAALRLATVSEPDFIIIGTPPARHGWLGLLAELRAACPAARLLIYTSQDLWPFAGRSIAAGAGGYVAKEEQLHVVAEALETIALGQVFLSALVRQHMGRNQTGQCRILYGLARLSAREMLVLERLGHGRTVREIAQELGLSNKTVGTYCDRIKQKLDLPGFRQMDALARDLVAGRLGPLPQPDRQPFASDRPEATGRSTR